MSKKTDFWRFVLAASATLRPVTPIITTMDVVMIGVTGYG